MKICTKCRTVKSYDSFSKDNSRKDNLQVWCKACKSKANAGRVKVLSDETRAKSTYNSKLWRQSNREKVRAYNRKWQKENKEYFQSYYRIYNQDERNKRKNADRQRLREKKLEDQWGIVPDDYWEIISDLYGEKCIVPWCDKEITKANPLTLDHIIPLDLATSFTKLHSIENFQIMCLSHNASKRITIIDFRPFAYEFEACDQVKRVI